MNQRLPRPWQSPKKVFWCSSYTWDPTTGEARLRYRYDDEPEVEEVWTFSHIDPHHDRLAADRAVRALWLMAGVSYYKAYLAPEIRVQGGVTDAEAEFFTHVWREGLGEFCYLNQISRNQIAPFTPSKDVPVLDESDQSHDGIIVPLGGGKDSLTTVGMLERAGLDFRTWTVGHSVLLHPQIDRIGKPHWQVGRRLAPEIRTWNAEGALNGHVPLSAFLACAGVVQGVVSKQQYVVLSNEHSANFGNTEWEGRIVNHQYSKSLDFERRFSAYIRTHVTTKVEYCSLLRPLTELQITKEFVQGGMWNRMRDVFSSCNRNFIQDTPEGKKLAWCTECPKCAFVWVMLSAFVPRDELVTMFGANLYAKKELFPLFQALLGVEDHKPFECVGTYAEVATAIRMAQHNWPEVRDWDLPPCDFDMEALHAHQLPPLLAHVVEDTVCDRCEERVE